MSDRDTVSKATSPYRPRIITDSTIPFPIAYVHLGRNPEGLPPIDLIGHDPGPAAYPANIAHHAYNFYGTVNYHGKVSYRFHHHHGTLALSMAKPVMKHFRIQTESRQKEYDREIG